MSLKERDQYSGNNICTREQKEYGDATDRGFKKVINPFIRYLVFIVLGIYGTSTFKIKNFIFSFFRKVIYSTGTHHSNVSRDFWPPVL